jgi:hypothetical protein
MTELEKELKEEIAVAKEEITQAHDNFVLRINSLCRQHFHNQAFLGLVLAELENELADELESEGALRLCLTGK